MSFLAKARKNIDIKAKAPRKRKTNYGHSFTIEVTVVSAEDLSFLSSESFKEDVFKACMVAALNEIPDGATEEEKTKILNTVARTLKVHLLSSYEEIYQSTRKANAELIDDMAKALDTSISNPL